MSAKIRTPFFLGAACLALLASTSCTARYQEMIRAREATIQDLENSLSKMGESNRMLREENDRLKARVAALSSAKKPVKAVEASAPKKTGILDELNRDLERSGLPELKARYRHGRVSIGLPNQITFQPGSTRISPEGRNLLNRLAKFLLRNRGKRIWVEGHTDRDPIRKTKKKYRSNRHLSVERADAVATWLIEKGGVPADRIVIVGYGPYDPVSPGDKARNRRVEIVLAN